jgi:hypothetical protein
LRSVVHRRAQKSDHRKIASAGCREQRTALAIPTRRARPVGLVASVIPLYAIELYRQRKRITPLVAAT